MGDPSSLDSRSNACNEEPLAGESGISIGRRL